MNYQLHSLEQTVSQLTGYSPDYLRQTSIDELRARAENETGRKMIITGIATRVVRIFSEKITVLG